ncbi:MAG TPA: thioredoxin family protein [Aequorivita sp.]|nr:thioredoxin family protein [Aequorivita sp.]
MKNTFLFIITISLFGCNSTKEKQNTETNSSTLIMEASNQPEINKTVPYEDAVMLLGMANRQGLQKDGFEKWFNPGYEEYTPDAETLEQLKSLLNNVHITVFMGTWCEDSHAEVPHLYKILDEVGYDENKITLITVSEEKTTPEGLEIGNDIINVPTIILVKNEKELGRIVEYPIETLEKDMTTILSGKTYKHAYAD